MVAKKLENASTQDHDGEETGFRLLFAFGFIENSSVNTDEYLLEQPTEKLIELCNNDETQGRGAGVYYGILPEAYNWYVEQVMNRIASKDEDKKPQAHFFVEPVGEHTLKDYVHDMKGANRNIVHGFIEQVARGSSQPDPMEALLAGLARVSGEGSPFDED